MSSLTGVPSTVLGLQKASDPALWDCSVAWGVVAKGEEQRVDETA